MNEVTEALGEWALATAKAGGTKYVTETLLGRLNKNKKKPNTIIPRPDFSFRLEKNPLQTDLYLEITEKSNHWVECILETYGVSERIILVHEGPLQLSALKPNETLRVRIGYIDGDFDISENEIEIKFTYRSDDSLENWTQRTVFSDTSEVLIESAEPAKNIWQDLKFEFGPILKPHTSNASDMLDAFIAHALKGYDGLARRLYRSQLEEWRLKALLDPDSVRSCSSSTPFFASVSNVSKIRELKDIEITLLFPSDLRWKPSQELQIPRYKELGSLEGLLDSSEAELFASVMSSNTDLYSGINDSGYLDDLPKMRANSTFDMVGADQKKVLLWFGNPDITEVPITVQLRSSSFGFAEKEFLLPVSRN